MKKLRIVLINILIIAFVVVVVFLYLGNSRQKAYRDELEHFRNLTSAMEKVTENYLEGEQHICDVWTHHINSSKMTLEDATEFVRDSHVHAKVSAHLILIDDGSMSGLSTKPGSDGGYSVSYKDMASIFNDLGLILASSARESISQRPTRTPRTESGQ